MVKLWCSCHSWKSPKIVNDVVFCSKCSNPIPCEICDDSNLSAVIHVDYVVCKEHKFVYFDGNEIDEIELGVLDIGRMDKSK